MRFKNHDNYFLDTKTGLKWALATTGIRTWDEAVKALPGFRLPTMQELFALVDFTTNHPATHLPQMLPSYYWSATSYAILDNCAWGIYFDRGDTGRNYKSSRFYVRYVKED